VKQYVIRNNGQFVRSGTCPESQFELQAHNPGDEVFEPIEPIYDPSQAEFDENGRVRRKLNPA
jgi:hypothetical protein